MTGVPKIPKAPEEPEWFPRSYDMWQPQRELKALEKWMGDVEHYVDEPESRRMREFLVQKGPLCPDPHMNIIAMPACMYETAMRKVEAYNVLRSSVRRLVHFLEGQEHALQELAQSLHRRH